MLCKRPIQTEYPVPDPNRASCLLSAFKYGAIDRNKSIQSFMIKIECFEITYEAAPCCRRGDDGQMWF